jgi:hypothetical protein
MKLHNVLLTWVTVGDGKVCPNCRDYGRMEPADLLTWAEERTTPGAGDTYCEDHCRCFLFPVSLISFDTRFEREFFTKKKGRLKVVSAADEILQEEALRDNIMEWQYKTDNWNLPDRYYEIEGVTQKKEYLDGLLERLNDNALTSKDWDAIRRANPWMD